jgi:DNA invertase Pin-like site-specific DNA recombinase
MSTKPARCAIWGRVSTEDQHTENQLTMLREWADALGMEIAVEYVTEDSAWADRSNGTGTKGAEFEAQRSAMLAGVRRGTFTVILVRAIDRLSRRGTEDMMRYLRLLAENGADVRSDQESWLNTADPFAREILIGVFATLAKYQSEQRSRNIKAGLARKKAAGEKVGGRKPGAKDKRPRKRRGSPVREAS